MVGQPFIRANYVNNKDLTLVSPLFAVNGYLFCHTYYKEIIYGGIALI